MKALLISDTHCIHHKIDLKVLDFFDDINFIIHSGDFSVDKETFLSFIKWYSSLPIEHKILVPGNHDFHCEKRKKESIEIAKENGIHLLIDNEIVLEGIKFYGTPWSVTYHNWHFMKDDFNLQYKWKKIPQDTEVLICHTPPYGILDEETYNNIGSKTLNDKIDTLNKLKLCCFGHAHKGRGFINKGGITFVNASSLGKNSIIHKPFLFDFDNFEIII